MADPVIMSLHGKCYDADMVKKIGGSGIPVSIKLSDINLDDNPDHLVSFDIPNFSFDELSVVFYKQHGKYTPIMGKKHVLSHLETLKPNLEVRGKLVTSVALKRARIDFEGDE